MKVYYDDAHAPQMLNRLDDFLTEEFDVKSVKKSDKDGYLVIDWSLFVHAIDRYLKEYDFKIGNPWCRFEDSQFPIYEVELNADGGYRIVGFLNIEHGCGQSANVYVTNYNRDKISIIYQIY